MYKTRRKTSRKTRTLRGNNNKSAITKELSKELDAINETADGINDIINTLSDSVFKIKEMAKSL